MLQDIQCLYRKYNLPKMIGFVPDRLEITLKRDHNNQFTLLYNEFFQYLPEHALDTARENAIQLVQKPNVLIKEIQPIEHGVRVQMTGDFQIVLQLILELLIQIEGNEATVKSNLDAIYQRYQMFVNLLDFYWHWNVEVQRIFEQLSSAFNTVMEEYPTFYQELMAILHKTAQSKHCSK